MLSSLYKPIFVPHMFFLLVQRALVFPKSYSIYLNLQLVPCPHSSPPSSFLQGSLGCFRNLAGWNEQEQQNLHQFHLENNKRNFLRDDGEIISLPFINCYIHLLEKHCLFTPTFASAFDCPRDLMPGSSFSFLWDSWLNTPDVHRQRWAQYEL